MRTAAALLLAALLAAPATPAAAQEEPRAPHPLAPSPTPSPQPGEGEHPLDGGEGLAPSREGVPLSRQEGGGGRGDGGEGFLEAAPFPGPLIRAIEIRSAAAIPEETLEEDVLPLIALEVGGPLTDDAVTRTLRNLQATGLASEVELYTREPEGAAEGVVAILVLRPVERVTAVRLEGDLGGFRASDLRREVPQGEAEPLREDQVLRGVRQLEAFYRARGFFDAQVRIRVGADPEGRGTAVTYLVQSGPRATIAAVEFQGETAPFTPGQLIEQLEQQPGRPYDQSTLREDVDRLQTWLVQQGYRAADVRPPEESVDLAANTVTLTYPVEIGPRVSATVVGADLEELRRENLLPFLGEQGFDEALVAQAVDRIRRHYQEQGHYHVQVDSRIVEEGDDLRVVLTVEPGPVYTLQELRFTGNETFDAERLTELMATAPRGALARFGLGSRGRLVAEELDADLENLLAFYRWEGFPEAEVGPARVMEEGEELRLEIPIREGPRQVVETLEFRDVRAIDPGGLDLPLKPEGPFSPARLDQTLARLRQAYLDRGYASAQVSARQEWDPQRSRGNVIIEALEGPRVLLDRVIVRGNQRTDSDVIRRSIALRPGDPVSQARVYEIERDLYRLGIFSSVDAELTLAGLETSTRDLLVRVREGRPRRVAYGLGVEYSQEDGELIPRGSFGFTHNNLAGRALTLRADLRVSGRFRDGVEGVGDRVDLSSRLLLGQPYLGRYPIPTTYSLFYFDESRDFGNVTRQGARVEAHRDFGDRRVGLVYDYRLVELTDAADPFQVEPEDHDLQISSLVPSFFWDRRNDPLLATRGWSSLAQLQYAFPFVEAEGEFLKLFVQQTQYLLLNGQPPAGLEHVVAASLRAGGIEPFASLRPELSFPARLRQQGLPSADVFIDERFFAGGATTHRAYGLDDLGIRGETLILRPGEGRDPEDPRDYYPAGGNGLLLFNLEYRFPLFGPVFGGSLFYDAGNVWPDWRDIDVHGVKQGIGVGVRYNSPIGPLRIDFGYKLDPDPGEDGSDRYQFSFTFGNPF